MGLLEGYLRTVSPSYAAREKEQRAQDKEYERVDYLQGLLGEVDTPEQNLAPDAFNMDEAALMQQMDQTDQVYQQGKQGTGLLGGHLSPQEIAMKFMQAPGANAQELGREQMGNILNPKAAGDLYSNFKQDKDGKTYAYNKNTHRIEEIQGETILQKEHSPMVTIDNSDKSDPKPGPVTGMVAVKNPETGGWEMRVVPNGPLDLEGPNNVRLESKDYAKDFTPIRRINSGIKSLKNTVNKYGVTPVPGQLGNSLAAQSTDIMMSLKEYYNLGVLSGPDEVLMKKITSDPTSLKAALLGKDAYIAQLEEVEGIMRRAHSSLDEQYSHSRQAKKHIAEKKAYLEKITADLGE
jgi:hypothetical protein